MTYEAWRITYQSSEGAARAAWEECQRLQRIIDSRPAINAGLQEAYIKWTRGIYQCEINQELGHDA